MEVLLIEDDKAMADALITALHRRGYRVTRVGTAAQALDAIGATAPYSVILLDLGLPDGDGLDVCRAIRALSEIPIITLTGRSDERDKVLGLRAGADDYVVKPFGVAELDARIHSVLRRAAPTRTGALVVGDLRIDLDRHEVTRGGVPVRLTRTEFKLLATLARRAGSVVTRDLLVYEVWRTQWDGGGRALDVHISSVRSKLGSPPVLETVRGVGFRITASSRAEPGDAGLLPDAGIPGPAASSRREVDRQEPDMTDIRRASGDLRAPRRSGRPPARRPALR